MKTMKIKKISVYSNKFHPRYLAISLISVGLSSQMVGCDNKKSTKGAADRTVGIESSGRTANSSSTNRRNNPGKVNSNQSLIAEELTSNIEMMLDEVDESAIRSGILNILLEYNIAAIDEIAGRFADVGHPVHDSGKLVSMFAGIIVKLYLDGRLENMSEIVKAISQEKEQGFSAEAQNSRAARQRLATSVFAELIKSGDKDAVIRAFIEVCENPLPQTHTVGILAERAAFHLGFERALGMIPPKEVFGENAVKQSNRSIIQAWMAVDSIACSEFIREYPEGDKRLDYISILVVNLARSGFMEDAKSWFQMLPDGTDYANRAEQAIEEFSLID
jgi:hypothetical protein